MTPIVTTPKGRALGLLGPSQRLSSQAMVTYHVPVAVRRLAIDSLHRHDPQCIPRYPCVPCVMCCETRCCFSSCASSLPFSRACPVLRAWRASMHSCYQRDFFIGFHVS